MDRHQILETLHQRCGIPGIELADTLVTCKTVTLSRTDLEKVRQAIRGLWWWHQTRQIKYLESAPEVARHQPGNASIMMSVDFHPSPEGLKLIEINTNAAGLLLFSCISECTGHPMELESPLEEELVRSIQEEWSDFGSPRPLQRIAIIDENPKDQFFYPEFLLAQKLLKEKGYQCEILDARELCWDGSSLFGGSFESIDLVYNRTTDFYLQNLEALREAYLNKAICLTPHPQEYHLSALKDRLIDLATDQSPDRTNDFRQLQSMIPRTWRLTDWINETGASKAARKRVFFKPRNSFGGKAVYRGESISNKVFESLDPANYLVQEYVPAPEIEFGAEGRFKYDLRFYFYKDRLQGYGARIYRGQVTNLREPGAGFASVEMA